jgi:hypothetical protein
MQEVYASESSSYESGYDHGCDDAGIADPDERYINQPERGPAFHTDEFMQGYDAGFYACGGGGVPQEPYYQEPYYEEPRQSGGINWEDLCYQYGGLIGIKDPYYEYANGTELTEKGRTALVCLLGGAVTLFATLDPATKAEILALGRQYCP